LRFCCGITAPKKVSLKKMLDGNLGGVESAFKRGGDSKVAKHANTQPSASLMAKKEGRMMTSSSSSKVRWQILIYLLLAGSAFGQEASCTEPPSEDPGSGETALVMLVVEPANADDAYYAEKGDGSWNNPHSVTTGDGFQRIQELYHARSTQSDNRDNTRAGDVLYMSEDERMKITLGNPSPQADAPEALWVKMDISGYHLKYESTDTYGSRTSSAIYWLQEALQEMEDYYYITGRAGTLSPPLSGTRLTLGADVTWHWVYDFDSDTVTLEEDSSVDVVTGMQGGWQLKRELTMHDLKLTKTTWWSELDLAREWVQHSKVETQTVPLEPLLADPSPHEPIDLTEPFNPPEFE
jgi:hypothetical protein